MIRNARLKVVTVALFAGALAATTLSSGVAEAKSSPKLGEIVVTKSTSASASAPSLSEIVVTK